MRYLKRYFITFLFLITTSLIYSQVQVDKNQLPNYLNISVQPSKLLGGIRVKIYHHQSQYKKILQQLEEFIVIKGGIKVKTIIDLFEVMDEIGFEYVDSFSLKYPQNKNEAITIENLIFKKKKTLTILPRQ